MMNNISRESALEDVDDGHVEGEFNSVIQLRSPQQHQPPPPQHDSMNESPSVTSTSVSPPQRQQQQLQQQHRSRFVLGMMRGIFSSGLRNGQSRRNLDTTNQSDDANNINISSTYAGTGSNNSDGDGEEMFHSPLPTATIRSQYQSNRSDDSETGNNNDRNINELKDYSDQREDITTPMVRNEIGNSYSTAISDEITTTSSLLRDHPHPLQSPLHGDSEEQFYTPREEYRLRLTKNDPNDNEDDANNHSTQLPQRQGPLSPPLALSPMVGDWTTYDLQNDPHSITTQEDGQRQMSHPSTPSLSPVAMELLTSHVDAAMERHLPEKHRHEEGEVCTSTYAVDVDVQQHHMNYTSPSSPSSYHYEPFYPNVSLNFEHMGQSIESLLISHSVARAPILLQPEIIDQNADDLSLSNHTNAMAADFSQSYHQRRSSTGGASVNSSSNHYQSATTSLLRPFQQPQQRRRHSSLDSFTGHIRSSISSIVPVGSNVRGGGTLANYHRPRRRRVSTSSNVIAQRRRSSSAAYSTNSSTAASLPPQQQRRNSTIGTDAHHSSRNVHNVAFTRTPVDVLVLNSSTQDDHPRRSSSIATTNQFLQQQYQFRSSSKPNHNGNGNVDDHDSCGPNILLNLMARESTGKSIYPRSSIISSSYNELQKLQYMTGGGFMKKYINAPSRGMLTEIQLLSNTIDNGDWNETYRCINRLETRLISSNDVHRPSTSNNQDQQQDPTLPQNAHRYYAGGGRNGYDRDVFTLYGGVQVLLRIFDEKAFVGQEMSDSYDARDLTTNIVTTRLAPCWIDVLTILRELIIYIPSLMDGAALVDDYNFLPFLFTLLAHDSLFDAAATLIEEMLSIMSQTQQSPNHDDATASPSSHHVPDIMPFPPARPKPTMTFFLGNVSDLYKLWRGFNCRQLAHFCRILAFLIFEPEDRQLLESPAVLKSVELLQLRRNRTVRSGFDSTVDMNQSILLGDEVIIRRLLALLRTMNYAPSLSRLAHCHGMSLFPLVADTLFMVGLNELESWSEIDRQDALARTMLHEPTVDSENHQHRVARLCDLGAVSDMLETFMDTMTRNERRIPLTHVGHIIQVLSAAQQAGVIVGRNRQASQSRNLTNNGSNSYISDSDIEVSNGLSSDMPVDDSTIQGLESAAGLLSEQVFNRRFFSSNQDGSVAGESSTEEANAASIPGPRYMINTPEDAANSLQFNALLFSPYHVEVLFVLCTLLGGRRKLDAQDMMSRLGLVQVMDDMIQRLPWSDVYSASQPTSRRNGNIAATPDQSIHGPGCECTPENALCIQYLRLLHNFCDRDCENYDGRQVLLSSDEQDYISSIFACARNTNVGKWRELPPMKYGLLRKIIDAFLAESDESSYRFWLASCIEAFLRGSSTGEQMFVAQVGLVDHLVNEICCNRLHCAGSLQTSFDLLGEVGKGNEAVLELMVNNLDETRLHKLMNIASTNLVDSNVFLRSMLISVERIAATQNGSIPLHMDMKLSNIDYTAFNDEYGLYQCSITGSYLSFSWWDVPTIPMRTIDNSNTKKGYGSCYADSTPTDWFPTLDLLQYCHNNGGLASSVRIESENTKNRQVGWIFTPQKVEDEDNTSSSSWNIFAPNTIERLHWFVHTNQVQLLYDLLSVVNLRNINHENICCLNTAVVVAIFAYRRNELYQLMHDLHSMSASPSTNRQRQVWRQRLHYDDATTTNQLIHGIQSLSIVNETHTTSKHYDQNINDTNRRNNFNTCDILYNFRQVLWFWVEYYTHRGRDRLSLEYSSHLRYDDWISVVTILVNCCDHCLAKNTFDAEASISSLLFITTDHSTSTDTEASTVAKAAQYKCPRSMLPRSPYQRTAHVIVDTEFVSLRGE